MGEGRERLRALEPADVQAGHGAHALGVRRGALLEHRGKALADLEGVVQVLGLREPGVLLQGPAEASARKSGGRLEMARTS